MTNIGPITSKKLTAAKNITGTVEAEFILRGKNVGVAENGLVSLNDIQRIAGFSKNRRPIDWYRLPTTGPFIIAAYERIVGKSHHSKIRISDVYQASSGANGGTWAHPIIAASYAGYLKPELEVEMIEVWLRYKSADPILADEILQRATDEQNEWAARRAMGRSVRGVYTKELHERGVSKPLDFANCTNQTYQGLFDATAKKLKEQRGLSKSASLRDSMSMKEIAFLAASEALAVERMEDEDSDGFPECRLATSKAALSIRAAIDTDRRSRQKKLV